jgi:hypothetical protein
MISDAPNRKVIKAKSKRFSFGYLYERNGYWYSSIKGIRKKTPYAFKEKAAALKYLDYLIENDLYVLDRNLLSYLIEDFLQIKSMKNIKLKTLPLLLSTIK